ncbi:HTH_Tnp_Tc3_2 domain-containing protein [Trichonephila clavipes]|nr:HTH_Tnp_Tc3_2 domain-containing protein [Trichonephila clavipes]
MPGWSTRRVAGQVDRSECAVRSCWEQWTRECTHARKTGSGATREDHEERGSKDRVKALVDSTVTRSTIRADEHRQRVYSGAKPDQCGMSQIGKRLCLVMNPGLFCPGERYNSPHTVLRHTARTARVMVWGRSL